MHDWTSLSASNFSLERSLSCGQAFRWQEQKDGEWFGIAQDKAVFLRQDHDKLYLSCDEAQKSFWANYFGLDLDYAEVEQLLAANANTACCLEYSRGIRIFRQNAFETLISFIVSANNNVKRISGIIHEICRVLGERKMHGEQEYFAFPTPQALAQADELLLKQCGAGYRAPYIIKSAKKIAEEAYDLERLKSVDFAQARAELLKFSGVGPKVAECIMLFSLGFDQAFPVDVWVKRIIETMFEFGDGEAAAKQTAMQFGTWAGAAQQYLFHYARQIGLGKSKGSQKPDESIKLKI